MKNMDDYHDHYLKKDVLLLADVFEKFIDMCLKYCGLDPCHYFSSPGLSWYAMLKMTGIKLEKISDIDKYLFIKKGLTGGKPSIFINYFDMNNLYGWAMSKYLPYEEFQWLENIDEFNVMPISECSSIGFFFRS